VILRGERAANSIVQFQTIANFQVITGSNKPAMVFDIKKSFALTAKSHSAALDSNVRIEHWSGLSAVSQVHFFHGSRIFPWPNRNFNRKSRLLPRLDGLLGSVSSCNRNSCGFLHSARLEQGSV